MIGRRKLLIGGAAAGACGWTRPNGARLAADVHRGVCYAHIHHDGLGYGSERSREELAKLAAIGVRHVALMPFAYLPALDAPELLTGRGDLSDDAIRREGEAIRALGMVPVVKPHLWSRGFSAGKYAADIRMRDADGWARFLDAYGGWVENQASLAEEIGAGLLVIGTEMTATALENPGAFAAIAARARARYRGKLTYAAHWDREPEAFTDWAALDLIGIDAYYPLSSAPDPDRAALADGWRPVVDRLAALSEKHGRPVLFTEAGFPAVDGGATTPWAADGRANPELQARAYDALLEAFGGQSWWAGVYWWKWFTAGPTNGHDESNHDPAGKPAADVLARWYRE